MDRNLLPRLGAKAGDWDRKMPSMLYVSLEADDEELLVSDTHPPPPKKKIQIVKHQNVARTADRSRQQASVQAGGNYGLSMNIIFTPSMDSTVQAVPLVPDATTQFGWHWTAHPSAAARRIRSDKMAWQTHLFLQRRRSQRKTLFFFGCFFFYHGEPPRLQSNVRIQSLLKTSLYLFDLHVCREHKFIWF